MAIMTYILIFVGVAVISALFGGIYLFFYGGKKKKFSFILYNSDGSVNRVLHPTLWIDPENTSNRKFKFVEFNCTLDYAPPTVNIENKLYRECYLNDIGELSYVKKKIDKEDYLKISVTPEEKSLSMFRFKENQRRNQNDISKLQAFLLVGFFLMLIVVIGGSIYMGATAYSKFDTVQEIQKGQKDIIASMERLAQSNLDLIERQIQVSLILEGNKQYNATRQVS